MLVTSFGSVESGEYKRLQTSHLLGDSRLETPRQPAENHLVDELIYHPNRHHCTIEYYLS
eukprot:CCRYP_000313-RB/>CCRYP_000313-RB protein AED:0.38 eAED:0.42 QI:1989/0.75/0.8/1/0/0/5/0/59